MRNFPESDWKRFRTLHKVLLERFSERILAELTAAIQSREQSAHDRYIKAYNLIRERDKEMAQAFDDFRRSTAFLQLCIMRRMGLLKDDELELFSEETKSGVKSLVRE